MRPTLFVETNQYLNLYRMVAGKKLLDSLEEQKAYIFISAQIVDEVIRNKLRCAQVFFDSQFKEITKEIKVPDHLLGLSDEDTTKLRSTLDDVRKKLAQSASETLSKISISEDSVSKRLGALFDKSVLPSGDEMQRARERKERGNPPGKKGDPLGDQISWEQLLTYCKQSKTKRLWIVTSDGDFGIEHQNKRFLLNSLLRQNLIEACGTDLEINCFGDLLAGITDFGKNAGVKAEKLPTEEQATEIEKEIEGLPPFGWMPKVDDASMNAIFLRNRIAALQAAGASAGTAIGIFTSAPDITLPASYTTGPAKLDL